MATISSPRVTTPRSSRKKNNENTPEPGSRDAWSKSKCDRFSGYGSLYNAQLGQGPSSAHKTTPSKLSSSVTKGGRYATPAERLAIGTPPRSLSATFASSTDRFAGKTLGSVYGAVAANVPAAGQYDPAQPQAHVAGVIRLQKAIRRRQSRGIFAAQEAVAREVPAPGDYAAKAALASASTTREGIGMQSRTPRFAGPASIYNAEPTPDAGSYAPPLEAVSEGKQDATFASSASRFEGSRSIYAAGAANVPAAGEYDAHRPKLEEPIASAAFQGATDRFGGPDSLYAASAAPGVGTYAPPLEAVSETKQDATFASSTDRFASKTPGSVYAASAAPAVGTYAPPLDVVSETKQDSTFTSATDRFAGKTMGSVYGAVAANVPAGGEYDPEEPQPFVAGVIRLQQAIRRRQSRGIFAAREAVAREVPSPGKYAPPTAFAPPTLGGGDFAKGPERFQQGSIYKTAPTAPAPTAAAPAAPAAQPAAAPLGSTVQSEVGAQVAPLTSSSSSSRPSEVGSVRFSDGGTAVGAYEAFEPPRPSLLLPVDEAGDGAEPPLPEEAKEENKDDEGARLFAKLSGLADVDKADYFSSADGWDKEGLRSDLELYAK